MELVYQGKTKDLLRDEEGKTYFQFKDDVTGQDGVFDPGANQVGLTMEGSGRANVEVSTHFFNLLEENGVPTHFISSDTENGRMEIKQAEVFGKGLEVICRYIATGSFIRRYGLYAEDGDQLDGYVEYTLKDDDRDDPLINEDALVALGILEEGEYDQIKDLTLKISGLIKEDLEQRGLTLYDIKLEFGRISGSNEIVLIDEVSGGNMRVYDGDTSVSPLELPKYL